VCYDLDSGDHFHILSIVWVNLSLKPMNLPELEVIVHYTEQWYMCGIALLLATSLCIGFCHHSCRKPVKSPLHYACFGHFSPLQWVNF